MPKYLMLRLKTDLVAARCRGNLFAAPARFSVSVIYDRCPSEMLLRTRGAGEQEEQEEQEEKEEQEEQEERKLPLPSGAYR